MMSTSSDSIQKPRSNQNIQVFVRVRPTNAREKLIKSNEVVETQGLKDVVVKQTHDSRSTKKFSFDRAFGMNSQQHEVYQTVVAPLIQEVIDGYNCTVFAYGQTGTGKTYTMVGEEQSLLSSQYDDISSVGMIPRALTHLFDKLRLDKCEFAMRVSYLELYNEELCDLLSTDDNVKIRIFDDANKKGSVIVQGLEEIPVRCKDDVYKLLAKGQERRKTAATLMNAQSSRSHTVFSILVHIKENGQDGEDMLKIGKLNLVDLAGSENISKAGNEKGIRTRESVNINQSLLTLGRVITALVERAPHIPYRESKLTRLLQESLGGRTKTSIIATISCGHKDLEETLSTLDYAHRAKNIQNKPEINQRLTKKVILKEYTEEIDRLKRDLLAAREKNGIFLAADSYNDMLFKMENTEKELNEVMGAFTKVKEELNTKMKLFEETKQNLVATAEQLLITEGKFKITETELSKTKRNLRKAERNVNEVKHLVSCHLETEHKLTEQTKEIMKVADEASHDTKSLQENIRRRKEKDENAAKASNELLDGLTNQMQNMEKNLQELEKHHKESSDIIVTDLNAFKESNSNFTSMIVDSLKELKNIQKSSQDELFKIFEKWTKGQQENASNDSGVSFATYFNALKERDDVLFKSVNTHINVIQELLNERKSQENKLSEYIIGRLNEQQKSSDNFAHYLQSKFNHYCDELKSLKSSINQKTGHQNDKFQEIKKLILELENYSVDQDEIISKKVSSLHEDIEGNGLSTATNFIQSSHNENQTSIQHLERERSNMNEEYNKLHKEIKSSINIMQEDEKIRKETLKIQLENIDCFETEIKSHLDATCTNVNEKHDRLDQNITTESSKSSIKLTEIRSVVQHDLHLAVEEAESDLLRAIEQATNNIGQFRNEEVYLYRSTGETPVRKDYKYNRNLNATSPHDRIIKRLRLEQGLSDSLLHDSSIMEEDEVNFTSKEICNSTAIVDNMAIDAPKFVSEGRNVDDNQENVPLNF